MSDNILLTVECMETNLSHTVFDTVTNRKVLDRMKIGSKVSSIKFNKLAEYSEWLNKWNNVCKSFNQRQSVSMDGECVVEHDITYVSRHFNRQPF